MILRYAVLASRVEAELADVHRAADKAVAAYEHAVQDEIDSTFYLDSIAMNLHAVYGGIERIFEGIARELDGGLPAGPNWHRVLLSQMAIDVAGVRPVVIRQSTAQALDEYLRFRHLVRNLYTWSLDAAKLAELIAGLTPMLNNLDHDLAAFGRFLDAASHVDEFASSD